MLVAHPCFGVARRGSLDVKLRRFLSMTSAFYWRSENCLGPGLIGHGKPHRSRELSYSHMRSSQVQRKRELSFGRPISFICVGSSILERGRKRALSQHAGLFVMKT